MKSKLSLLLTVVFAMLCFGNQALAATPNNPNGFIENKGQWPEEVAFLFQGPGINAWITDFGIVYDFRKVTLQNKGIQIATTKGKDAESGSRIDGHVVRMELESGSPPSGITLQAPHGGMKNYFLGNDPTKWGTDVQTFDEVVLKDIYEGIDIRYYQENGNLRYDFIVNPGADPAQITWEIAGVKSSLSRSGELLLHTSIGNVQQAELYTYQLVDGKKTEVGSAFKMNNTSVSFSIDSYDSTVPLIIDPVVYSSYLGGGDGFDEFAEVLVTSAGEKWLFGETPSNVYPTTVGSYSSSFSGEYDFIISKINATGDALLFSTYVGGANIESVYEAGNYAVLAPDGGLVFTGSTNSPDFPTVVGAFDASHNGDFDAIVAKISPAGNSLAFSTYIGGNLADYGQAIALDDAENIYLSGNTFTGDFPITGGAYDQTENGDGDAFITKMDATASNVLFSTLFGGNLYDDSFGIRLDDQNNIYIVGTTASTDLPALAGYDSDANGDYDMYVARMNSTGSSLMSCTYLGGSGRDEGWGMELTSDGDIVIAGYSTSTDFPTVNGNPFNGGNYDAVIGRLSADLSTYLFGTVYGGDGVDACWSLDVDEHNSIYISGTTNSTNLYLINPDYSSLQGQYDIFIARYATDGSVLYSTYFGGNLDERSMSTWCDNEGNVYVTGSSESSNYPVSSANVQGSISNSRDGMIAAINTCATNFASASVDSPTCENSSVTLMADGGQVYSWTGPNGFSSNDQNPSFTATNQSDGTYTVTVTDYGCTSTSEVTLTVEPALGTTIIGSTNVNALTPTNYVVGQNIGSTYSWSVTGGTIISGVGTNNVTITFPTSGTATITVTEENGACSETTSITVNIGCAAVPDPPTISGPATVNENTSGNYSVPAQSGYSYTWSVTGGTITSGQGTNTISVLWGNLGNGNVTIVWADANGCESSPADQSITILAQPPVPQWITIATDPNNDGVSAGLMDGTLLEYLYDYSTDSLFFRATVADMSTTNTQEVGMNVHLFYTGGGTTFDFWGDDNNASTNANGWHRLLTTWVTGTPPSNYSGTIGVADATGVNSQNFTNVSQGNLNMVVNQSTKTLTMGMLRADVIPASAINSPVTVAAAVGAHNGWNDDIYQPGATIDVSPQGIFENNISQLSIYPNPNNGTFSIDLRDTDFSTDATLSVIDNAGRTVLQRRIKDLLATIDLQTVTNGIYMLQVSENSAIGTARIAVFR